MENLLDLIAGPLNKDWCYYFYFITILSFLALLAAIVFCIANLFSKKMKMNALTALNIIITPLFSYYIARLYYNMCINSL